MNQEIYDWAKKYRDAGWNVIPLYNYGKNPSPIRWKEYEERMATDEEFEKWFTSEGVTGLGVITGKISGIVVVDEDSYKEGGKKVSLQSNMVSLTARKGKHYFFKWVDPIKTSGFRQGVNVEIKSDGGFIVLPPSEVVVEKMTGYTRKYVWYSKCAIEDLPPIAEEQLQDYRTSEDSDGKPVDITELVNAHLGTQHNNLRTFTLAVLNRFPQKEWAMAADLVRAAASQYDPPHPEDRVEKILRDCMLFIKKNPKEVVEAELADPAKPKTLNEVARLRIEERKLEAIAPFTGWPELDRLIKGFIPGHIYTFTGDTNVGKTTIACNFAEALRKQGKRTLYIALEPDVNVVEYMASIRLQKKFPDLTDEDLSVDDEYVQIFLQQDIKSVAELAKSVKEYAERFDLIVIDHIGYFVHGEKDWIQEQSNVIKQLAFLAKENKTAVMLIAHLRKPGFQKKSQDWVPTQNDIAGSGAFKQDSTEVMIAYRPTKSDDAFAINFSDIGAILVTKTKTGPNGSFPIIFSDKVAKVWSMEEANNSLEGKRFLQDREALTYQQNMRATEGWHSDEETDTGSED